MDQYAQDALQERIHQATEQTRNRLAKTIKNPIQLKPNTTGIPDQLKSGVEALPGKATDDVGVSALPKQKSEQSGVAQCVYGKEGMAPKKEEKKLPKKKKTRKDLKTRKNSHRLR